MLGVAPREPITQQRALPQRIRYLTFHVETNCVLSRCVDQGDRLQGTSACPAASVPIASCLPHKSRLIGFGGEERGRYDQGGPRRSDTQDERKVDSWNRPKGGKDRPGSGLKPPPFQLELQSGYALLPFQLKHPHTGKNNCR